MNNKKTGSIIALIAIAVIVVFGVMSLARKDTKTATGNAKSETTSATTDKKSTDDAALSNAVATNVSTLKEYAFSPPVIKVKVGETITWTNMDGVKHNVVASKDSPVQIDGPLIAHEETYQFKFDKAGTYKIHCAPHPYMHQIIQVTQ